MRTALSLAGLGMLALVVFAFYVAPPAQDFRDPGSARIIFFHVPAAIVCTLCFLAGGFFGWRYLRRRDPLDDARAAAANEVGALLGVVALLTGMVFAAMQWGKPWHWDPRQTSFLLQLMIYAAYFALRSSVEDDRRRAAVSSGYTLFAALTVPLLVYILPRLPLFKEVSLHPSNVMASKQGLDIPHRIGVYLGFATYGLLAFGLYRMRLTISQLEARLHELANRSEHQHTHRVGWNLRVSAVAPNADRETPETPAGA
ncbi:MAG: cytochrome c biogenesis protein [bacterium]|nr:cytochrome c biogenesis protein [bacterium]